MWAKKGFVCVGSSESSDWAFRGCVRVVALIMMKRVKRRVVGGQDTTRRSAAERAKFSKWDRDFMLQPSTAWVGSEVGSERQLISRRSPWGRHIGDRTNGDSCSELWMLRFRFALVPSPVL